MKRYLKKFEITEEFVKNSVYDCLNHGRWKRRDTSYMLADYYMQMKRTRIEKHYIAKALRRIAYTDKSELYPIVDYASRCIFDEIKERDIKLLPIRYQMRKDNSNGKVREIGISSMKQQLYDYIMVNACQKMFMAKIGTYQCASIKGRGQIYGKTAIEKWFRKNPKKCQWIVQCDVKKYYPSVDKDVLKNLLKRDIANEDVLHTLYILIDSYKDGLCIGSYLSQFLANYLLSYAYHYLDEHCFKLKRGKRTNLVYKKLFYMDDMFMCGYRKQDVIKAFTMLRTYLKYELHLEIKDGWKIHNMNDYPTDMMGFKMNDEYTEVRQRIFKRANKLYGKYKNLSIEMTEKDARSCTSYYGYFKNSDSKAYMEKMKVIRTLKKAKDVIRYADRNLHEQNASVPVYGTS